ncbi:MAG: type I-B CRISPR-associated protein Cas5 [Ignavibacteriaceae bacterium]|nr:type I-B CRISPR-associated protein Cas5 [Ignavibacteriaceae bacterium]
MSEKIISIELKSLFGFIKKPDTNDGILISYNSLHKPGLLGILGAIAGLSGFESFEKSPPSKQKKHADFSEENLFGDLEKDDLINLPEYYRKLYDIKCAIRPVGVNTAVFKKSLIAYNNSTGLASNETGGNLIVKEQMLISPIYRVYIKVNSGNPLHEQIYDSLKSNEAVFLPYLGKNEFQLWWDNFTEYKIEELEIPEAGYKIDSLFIKLDDSKITVTQKVNLFKKISSSPLFYFERLPVDYNLQLKNYEIKEFVLTDAILSKDYIPENICKISTGDSIKYIQLN